MYEIVANIYQYVVSKLVIICIVLFSLKLILNLVKIRCRKWKILDGD
jgi:hypothetical protein